MPNCSDLQNSFGLESRSWLGISTVEKGYDKKCYYKKEDVDKYIVRLKGDHEAKANKLKQEAKITMQDVHQQPGELDNHYYQRIYNELFDKDNRRVPLVDNYVRVINRINQSALPPPLPPIARGIINKNQKKKQKTKSKKRKLKKRKSKKKRNKTKKSKK